MNVKGVFYNVPIFVKAYEHCNHPWAPGWIVHLGRHLIRHPHQFIPLLLRNLAAVALYSLNRCVHCVLCLSLAEGGVGGWSLTMALLNPSHSLGLRKAFG
jgi:hypothetical protein